MPQFYPHYTFDTCPQFGSPTTKVSGSTRAPDSTPATTVTGSTRAPSYTSSILLPRAPSFTIL